MGKGRLSFLLLLVCISIYPQDRYEYAQQQMGTQIRLVFYTSHKNKADSIAALAFHRIDELNKKLSDYLEDSELNSLSKQSFKEVMVSEDLFNVLQKAKEISEITNGAFDITVGPLIQLWRKTHKSHILPSVSDIAAAKMSVGFSYIVFPRQNTVQLNAKGMQLDLGGIGKGYTADQVIKVFEANGVHSALVDMGGDIRVSNPPPNNKHWVLAFSYFNQEGEEVVQKLRLRNEAVATSGDLYQYVEMSGIRYSHIVNPITGMALNNTIQVTTIAENATLADAFASAFSVMGFGDGMVSSIELPNLEVFMVGRSKEGYQQWNSLGFNRHTLSD